MKTRNIISTLAATAFAFFLTGCEGEQEPVIIEGDLPIKTSCLFMVGDATPNGWNIDNPTPLKPLPTMHSSFRGRGRCTKAR